VKHIKLLIAAIVAIVALTAIAAATASAEELPNILATAEATEKAPVTGTSSSGATEFGSGFTTLKSTKSEGTQSQTSPKLGTFDVLFLEVKTILGGSCTGLNDTKEGSVLVLGTFHVRHYNSGATLLTALIFLLNEVHFTCEGKLILVKGCVAGRVTPEGGGKVKSLTATLEVEKGDNKIVKVLNESNTGEENCELLASQNAKEFTLSAQKQTQTITGFKQNGKAAEVEVMPL
jgi:hypothetical protein